MRNIVNSTIDIRHLKCKKKTVGKIIRLLNTPKGCCAHGYFGGGFG